MGFLNAKILMPFVIIIIHTEKLLAGVEWVVPMNGSDLVLVRMKWHLITQEWPRISLCSEMAFTYGIRKNYLFLHDRTCSSDWSHTVVPPDIFGEDWPQRPSVWGSRCAAAPAEPGNGSNLSCPPCVIISCESWVCLVGPCWDHCGHKHFTVVEGVILVTKEGRKCTPQPTSIQVRISVSCKNFHPAFTRVCSLEQVLVVRFVPLWQCFTRKRSQVLLDF